ncbi:MAG: hypothetical protein ABIQ86_07455 [Steroidobacteraceae bacterium]
MKTVLRIAQGFCWSIIPLQSWIVLLGAVFLLGAMGFGAFEQEPQDIHIYAMVGMAGAIIIAFVPALSGGAALRFASSRSMLHLRPRGRATMLSASMLAITALAALIALPVLLGQFATQSAGFAPIPRSPLPAHVFAVSWSVMALLWGIVFVASGSRAFSFLAILPIFIVPPLLIHSSQAALDLPGPFTWFLLALAFWLLFTVWYMRADAFRTPRWFGDRSSQNFESTPAGMVSSLLDFSRSALSPQRAGSLLLLGASSPLRYAITNTVWLAVIFLFFAVMGTGSARARAGRVPGMEFVLVFGATLGAQLAYMSARRARLLWLRAGSDRMSLFAMAERNGLAATLWSLLLTAAIVGCFTLLRAPDFARSLLLFAAAQLPAWVAAYYCGMSLTRTPNLIDVCLCIGLVLLFFVQMVFVQPKVDVSSLQLSLAAAFWLGLSILLRALAKRRWRALDWRIARLTFPSQRTG